MANHRNRFPARRRFLKQSTALTASVVALPALAAPGETQPSSAPAPAVPPASTPARAPATVRVVRAGRLAPRRRRDEEAQ